MIDAVGSYHAHPLSCGVTKFNAQLAARLRLPHLTDLSWMKRTCYPVLSLKWSEITPEAQKAIRAWCAFNRYRVLWHDDGDAGVSAGADDVQYASVLGCPATIDGNATRGTIDVLTFGMAHKQNASSLARVKTLLDATGQSYTVSVSSAIHAGDAWEARMDESARLMRELFGDHLRVMGFLADDAIARLLRQVTHVALFYEPAARANHTTLWAALAAGVPTITNLDRHSPSVLQHNVSVYNLAQLEEFPTEAARHREVRHGGTQAAAQYSWDRLLAVLQPSEVGA